MQKIGAIIDKIPMQLLIVMTIFLGLAPYFPLMADAPHLITKLDMLVSGALSKPIDIFDLLFHAAAPVLLVIRLVRKFGKKADV